MKKLLFVGILLLSSVSRVMAGSFQVSCYGAEAIPEFEYERNEFVFIGKVLSSEVVGSLGEFSPPGIRHAIDISRILKGDNSSLEGRSHFIGAIYQLDVDKEYLFYANSYKGDILIRDCLVVETSNAMNNITIIENFLSKGVWDYRLAHIFYDAGRYFRTQITYDDQTGRRIDQKSAIYLGRGLQKRICRARSSRV